MWYLFFLRVSQQPSSMPISSRTSDAGWENVSSQKGLSLPVGTEVRSPELGTPSQRSPLNREKIVTEERWLSLWTLTPRPRTARHASYLLKAHAARAYRAVCGQGGCLRLWRGWGFVYLKHGGHLGLRLRAWSSGWNLGARISLRLWALIGISRMSSFEPNLD